MASDQDVDSSSTNPQSVTAKPAFLVAAVLVLVIAVLGVVVGVRVARSKDASPPPTTPPIATPTSSASTSNDPASSVCGLPAGAEGGTLDVPPPVTWAFQGSTAYPQSPEFGAAKTASEGFRYCFQHSPAGAVVMAANALVQGSDPKTGAAWAKYALADGPYRESLLGQLAGPTGAEGTRMKIAGFRVLSYDGTSARVDLGVRVSSQNQNLMISGIYELIWHDGDWKISADVDRPLDTASIPDLNGYIPWGE